MGTVVSLFQASASQETIEMLGSAHQAAERGEIVGALVVIIYRGHRYSVDAAGAAKDDPTFSRGILCKLDDELAKLPQPPRR